MEKKTLIFREVSLKKSRCGIFDHLLLIFHESPNSIYIPHLKILIPHRILLLWNFKLRSLHTSKLLLWISFYTSHPFIKFICPLGLFQRINERISPHQQFSLLPSFSSQSLISIQKLVFGAMFSRLKKIQMASKIPGLKFFFEVFLQAIGESARRWSSAQNIDIQSQYSNCIWHLEDWLWVVPNHSLYRQFVQCWHYFSTKRQTNLVHHSFVYVNFFKQTHISYFLLLMVAFSFMFCSLG